MRSAFSIEPQARSACAQARPRRHGVAVLSPFCRYFVPWILHDSNTNVLAILPIVTPLSHAIPACSQQTAALWSPPTPVRSPCTGPEIALPPQPAADPAPAKASNDLAPCKPKNMLRHAPDHHMRPASTSASTPFSLHVTSRQHIHLQTTARKDKLARGHGYHLWSAWQRSPSTSPPASLEFMSPRREYSSVLFGSIIPRGGVTTVTVVASCAHCAGYLQSRPYCNPMSFSNRTHKLVAIHCFKIEQRQRTCRYGRPSRR